MAGPGRRIRTGLKLLSVALWVYAASALFAAASAGLFVAAYMERSDPVTSALNTAGSIMLFIGLGLSGFCFAFLVVGFSLAYRGSRDADPPIARPIALAHTLALAAYGLSFVAATLLILGFFRIGGVLVFQLGVVASAPAALAFAAAVTLPALRLGRRPGPTFAWAGAGVIIVGSIGELALALRPPSEIRTPEWLTLGGFPLVNWNLPFGIMVAVGALLVWLAYRFVSVNARVGSDETIRLDPTIERESVRSSER